MDLLFSRSGEPLMEVVCSFGFRVHVCRDEATGHKADGIGYKCRSLGCTVKGNSCLNSLEF